MDLLFLLFLGLALSVDTLTVSIILSLTTKHLGLKEIELPLFFGLAHIFMIILGYLITTFLAQIIVVFNQWLAFLLLTFLGVKTIFLARKKTSHTRPAQINLSSPFSLVVLLLATSLDAFALGMTFAIIKENIVVASVLVGFVVTVSSFIGLFFGKKLHFFKQRYSYITAGTILILLGLKILLEQFL